MNNFQIHDRANRSRSNPSGQAAYLDQLEKQCEALADSAGISDCLASREEQGKEANPESAAEQWQTLTNEIMRLEKIRSAALQIQAEIGAAEPIGRVIQIQEQKIAACEIKLEKLLMIRQRRKVVSEILVPNLRALAPR